MYSKKIQTFLKKKKINIGDEILIKRNSSLYSGILIPRPDMGDPDCVVIKLDSGYNVGVKFDKKTTIEKARKKTLKHAREEEEFELGKIKRKLLDVHFNSRKPSVSLIATGGTIASRIDYKTGGVYALEDPREFLHNVPELANIINMKRIMKPFTVMSEDMDYKHWQKIAKEASKSLNNGDKGVIITHGTDFLHMTAAALSFFLRNLYKPVILVGAQRSSDRGSSDAGMNLICSAYASVSDIAEVGVCMHGKIDDDYCLLIRGTHCRKMDTQRRDAFRPINEYPLAKIWPDGKIQIKNWNHKKRNDNENVEIDIKFEPKVAILKVYPGSDPDVINYYVSKGYKGFVIEAAGLGHVPTHAKKSWISVIKKHTKDGIPFVTTPQTIYGRINPNVYTNLRILYNEAGAIPGEDMLSEVAFVKLGWVLGHTNDMDNIRKSMLTNMVGEITERTLVGTFLY